MIYNSPVNSTVNSTKFISSLRVGAFINMMECSIKPAIENLNKLEALESMTALIGLLRSELNYPAGLQNCVYKSNNPGEVSDEEVKSFLFSILTPKKLSKLRQWITNEEDIKVHSAYKVDVILHTFINNKKELDMYTNQLINMGNGVRECNITLEYLLNLIEKTAELAINNEGGGAPTYEAVIGLLTILKHEIFHSNSAVLFTHEYNNSDDKVKNYLLSILSPEKLKALKIWLYYKDGLHSKNGHKLGIITSIYLPD